MIREEYQSKFDACPRWNVFDVFRWFLIVFLLEMTLEFQTASPIDPCTNHHVINDSWRNVANKPSLTSGQTYHCDKGRFSPTRWYAFAILGQKSSIPTTCIKDEMCGARIGMRIHLENQELPVEVGHNITASLCGTFNVLDKYDCCVLRTPVIIMRCRLNNLIYRFPHGVERCPVAVCVKKEGVANPYSVLATHGKRYATIKTVTAAATDVTNDKGGVTTTTAINPVQDDDPQQIDRSEVLIQVANDSDTTVTSNENDNSTRTTVVQSEAPSDMTASTTSVGGTGSPTQVGTDLIGDATNIPTTISSSSSPPPSSSLSPPTVAASVSTTPIIPPTSSSQNNPITTNGEILTVTVNTTSQKVTTTPGSKPKAITMEAKQADTIDSVAQSTPPANNTKAMDLSTNLTATKTTSPYQTSSSSSPSSSSTSSSLSSSSSSSSTAAASSSTAAASSLPPSFLSSLSSSLPSSSQSPTPSSASPLPSSSSPSSSSLSPSSSLSSSPSSSSTQSSSLSIPPLTPTSPPISTTASFSASRPVPSATISAKVIFLSSLRPSDTSAHYSISPRTQSTLNSAPSTSSSSTSLSSVSSSSSSTPSLAPASSTSSYSPSSASSSTTTSLLSSLSTSSSSWSSPSSSPLPSSSSSSSLPSLSSSPVSSLTSSTPLLTTGKTHPPNPEVVMRERVRLVFKGTYLNEPSFPYEIKNLIHSFLIDEVDQEEEHQTVWVNVTSVESRLDRTNQSTILDFKISHSMDEVSLHTFERWNLAGFIYEETNLTLVTTCRPSKKCGETVAQAPEETTDKQGAKSSMEKNLPVLIAVLCVCGVCIVVMVTGVICAKCRHRGVYKADSRQDIKHLQESRTYFDGTPSPFTDLQIMKDEETCEGSLGGSAVDGGADKENSWVVPLDEIDLDANDNGVVAKATEDTKL